MYKVVYTLNGVSCVTKPLSCETFAAARAFARFVLPRKAVITAVRRLSCSCR